MQNMNALGLKTKFVHYRPCYGFDPHTGYADAWNSTVLQSFSLIKEVKRHRMYRHRELYCIVIIQLNQGRQTTQDVQTQGTLLYCNNSA